MRYRISHKTIYQYTEQVSFCQNKGCLKPRTTNGQTVESLELRISPAPSGMEEFLDFYGNGVVLFTVQEAHKKLEVEVRSEVVAQGLPVPRDTVEWNAVIPWLRSDLSLKSLEAQEFLFASPYVPLGDAYRAYAAPSFPAGKPLIACVEEFNKRLHKEFTYKPQMTTISTPISEVLKTRMGVCQDFAHLMIACLRSLGIPARYVSGYLRTFPPAGKPRLIGADASHAWVSVYVPGEGCWVDFDPTNGKIPGDEHITVAWGRDYSDVSPLSGIVLGGSGQSLRVSVDVEPLGS